MASELTDELRAVFIYYCVRCGRPAHPGYACRTPAGRAALGSGG
jgi:hypothetical protein